MSPCSLSPSVILFNVGKIYYSSINYILVNQEKKI